jgi:antitoxin (DNA-binding transcriptional repressor) of toxin-antitoxin stability system
MSKTVTVEELREKPNELIEALEKGETVTLTREGKEFATISPTLQSGYRGVPYPFRDFDFGPRPKNLRTDPAQLIVEERERERSEKKWRS